jgi:predicted CoA-substrate-specific enzyme activase
MIAAGIDVGYRSTKVILLEEGQILVREESDQAEIAFTKALKKANLSKDRVACITATGVGRESIDFAQKYTPDVVAIAKGAFHHFPSMRTVFDIGAEQGRAVKCDATGKVLKFARNEKCAAGAGEFLEYIAKAVEVDIAEMGELALLSTEDVSVSGNCAVFAESEVVSLIHLNVAKADIIRALLDSLAMRTASLGQRVDCEKDIVVAGGLAQMKGFIKCLETHLNTGLLVPESPQFVSALGAALLSMDLKEAN